MCRFHLCLRTATQQKCLVVGRSRAPCSHFASSLFPGFCPHHLPDKTWEQWHRGLAPSVATASAAVVDSSLLIPPPLGSPSGERPSGFSAPSVSAPAQISSIDFLSSADPPGSVRTPVAGSPLPNAAFTTVRLPGVRPRLGPVRPVDFDDEDDAEVDAEVLDAADGEQIFQHDEDDEVEDLEDIAGWWSGENFLADQLRPFQMDYVSLPNVVQMKGSTIRDMASAPPPLSLPFLATIGLVKSTMREHQRMLIKMAAMGQHGDLLGAPATTAILQMLTREAMLKKWRASTLFKYLCTAQGCLALLPMYRRAPAIQLNQCPIWRQGMRGAGMRARQELPAQPMPATIDHVHQCLSTETNPILFAAILLAWLSCSRTGCILQLAHADVTLTMEGKLSIRFRKGKGVRLRGPYTVHTSVPMEWMPRLNAFLNSRVNGGNLFKGIKGTDIKISLRRVHPKLEQRSLRRGSLQLLSLVPNISDQLMMEFSGHTCVATLRRYLSWGSVAGHLREAMTTAAKQFATATLARRA